jgi:hypothetical protein
MPPALLFEGFNPRLSVGQFLTQDRFIGWEQPVVCLAFEFADTSRQEEDLLILLAQVVKHRARVGEQLALVDWRRAILGSKLFGQGFNVRAVQFKASADTSRPDATFRGMPLHLPSRDPENGSRLVNGDKIVWLTILHGERV